MTTDAVLGRTKAARGDSASNGGGFNWRTEGYVRAVGVNPPEIEDWVSELGQCACVRANLGQLALGSRSCDGRDGACMETRNAEDTAARCGRSGG